MKKSVLELSIVVCGKQNEKELNRTLNSLIGKLNSRHKLILILSDYTNRYLQEIESKLKDENFDLNLTEPKGPYNAMNLGLKLSNTKFVLFLNAGDELHSIENLNELLNKIGDRCWGFGEIIKIFPNKQSNYSFIPYSNFTHRLGIKYVPHPATILNRDLAIYLGGFDENYKVAADQKLLMQFGKTQKPLTLNIPIAKFYIGGLSSNRSYDKIVQDFQNISHEVFGNFLNSSIVDKFVWKIILKLRKLFT